MFGPMDDPSEERYPHPNKRSGLTNPFSFIFEHSFT